MHIMDVDYVRIQLPDLPDKPTGSTPGGQPVRIEKPRGQKVQQQVPLVSHRNQVGGMRQHAIAGTAVGNVTLPAVGYGQFSQRPHNFPGRSIFPHYGIDLKQLFHFPPTKIPVTRGRKRLPSA